MLGPCRAWRGGEALDLGPAGQRVVLGLLALACGRPLSRNEIAAGLWLDRQPPVSAANVIQTYVKNLRRLLEPGRPRRAASTILRQIGDGYALCVPESAVDLFRFRDGVAAATDLDSLERALALWHGPPLADVPALAAHPRVLALTDERHAALARYGAMAIAVGRAADGLPALEEAVAAQPLNEAWQALLIGAYQAAGRRREAFAAFHSVRRLLADELGVDPGQELSSAHAALLHADSPMDGGGIPAQLPADAPHFVGRRAELSQLDVMSGVVVVSGAPGVGKTALAVRWSHRIAHRFPDGQLYLNLRGFDPAGGAMEPADSVRWFLDALGVPPSRLPSTVDGQAALYRSLLAGRRMLIVLDNAREVAQVRPLLPGAPGCLVLVTSRNQLASLVAAEGAHPLPLDPLGPAEARELLAQRIGAARAAGEPGAVDEILDRCGGLPLALVIAAARAAMSANLPLAALADQLRRDRDRLDALTTGDPGTDLRAVFSSSYRALAPDAARLFGLLGLHPGPDISIPAAASLAAVPVASARKLLGELVRANLAAEQTVGRFTLHDLLRAFAAEACAGEPDRGAATSRMLDHYLHSAYAADRLSHPARDPLALDPPESAVAPEYPADPKDALSWFAAERAVLTAAVERAAAVSDRHAWQLAWSLSTFLDVRGHWDELATTQRTAITAAQRAGDPRGRADAHRLLARAHTRLHRDDDAQVELMRALELYRGLGDLSGQSNTHLNLALVRERQGRPAEALEHARQALDLFLELGEEHGQARALNAVGWYHALLGDHARALSLCRQALGRLEELDDRIGQATTLDSLGYAHHHLGDHERAVAHFEQAMGMYRELGDRHLEAFVHMHLGDAHESAGNAQAARAAWREALAILEQLDQPEAQRVQARLAPASAEPGGSLGRPIAIQSRSSRR